MGMASRDSRRPRWSERLQLALLQVALLFALFFGLSNPGHAHPGGLDGNGCHTNRKTGEYHCHRGPTASKGRTAATPPAPLSPSRAAPSRPASSERWFANCTEARAAGVTPIRRGEPGYAPHLDGDGDGTACEPHRGK